MVWKSRYIQWYRIIEDSFGTCVPHLTDLQIENMVFETDWMIVPLEGEADKIKAKNAMRPNLFIDLNDDKTIHFGIAYDKIGSVHGLRDIISPFNERERKELLSWMSRLDDTFKTVVNRKCKPDYFGQPPKYYPLFEEKSNGMSLDRFVKAYEVVDKIMAERSLLEPKRIYQLAPSIDLVKGKTSRNEAIFRKVISEIKEIYQMTTTQMKTSEQFQICQDCFCFTCAPKLTDCKCPCPSYPKPLGKVIECHKKDMPT